jgi:hypothetical protein
MRTASLKRSKRRVPCHRYHAPERLYIGPLYSYPIKQTMPTSATYV